MLLKPSADLAEGGPMDACKLALQEHSSELWQTLYDFNWCSAVQIFRGNIKLGLSISESCSYLMRDALQLTLSIGMLLPFFLV